MYCPGCATEVSTEQRYCRACGIDLQAITQAFAGQRPSEKKKTPGEPAVECDSPVGKLMRSMFWGAAMMFGGAGLGGVLRVLGRQGVRPAGEFTPYLEALAVLIALGGLFYLAYALLYATTGNRRSSKSAVPAAEPTSQLTQNRLPEPVLSVTEQTTELLEKADSSIPVRNTAPQG